MARPCTCDKEKCRLCWLYHNNAKYKNFFDKVDVKELVAKKLANQSMPRRKCNCKNDNNSNSNSNV